MKSISACFLWFSFGCISDPEPRAGSPIKSEKQVCVGVVVHVGGVVLHVGAVVVDSV